MKNLRLRNIELQNCLTVRELKQLLNIRHPDDCVVLKCGGKNFKFQSWDVKNGKLLLFGSR